MITTIRKFSDWLIHKKGDRFLKRYTPYYKGNLVDLGCGEAPYKEFLLQYATHYTGVDWSNTRHNTHADVISDLNTKIELPNNSADTIVSFSVMEHLCEPQIFLNESFRILKPNGYLIVQVPFQWWIHEQPYDYFRYTPYGLKHLLEKAGYDVVEIVPQAGFFTMMAMKVNYFTIRMFKLPKVLWVVWLIALIPIWTLNQLLALLLDSLDANPALETTGFCILAKKGS